MEKWDLGGKGECGKMKQKKEENVENKGKRRN